MQISPNIDYEEELFDALKELLEKLPGVKLPPEQLLEKLTDDRADAALEMEVGGRKVRLIVRVKKNGYPRDVHKDAGYLAGFPRHGGRAETVPVIAAPSLSPGSRELLRDVGVGYFDAGGSLYLPLSNGLYFIDRPAPSADRRLHNVYKGRSAQVLHVLLVEEGRRWHVSELAREAGVSPYTAHQVFTFLEKQLWVEREGKGPESVRVLREPTMLLDAWAEKYTLKQYEFRNYYRWSQSFGSLRQEVCGEMESREIEYALTLSSGAASVAPFATSVDRLHIIVPAAAKLDGVVEATGLKPAEDGANVTLMVARQRAPLMLRRRVDGICVASDVQLYLDLQSWPARGKEQAEYLRKERLGY